MRITELEAAAKTVGLRPFRGINITDLFRGYCSLDGDAGEVLFSTVSAFAHGRPFSVLASTMTPAGPGLSGTGGLGTIVASDVNTLGVTATAVETAAVALADLERYCGG